MQHLYSDSTSSIYLSDLCYVSTIKHLFISLKNLVVLVDHFIVQEHGVFVLKYSIPVIGFPAIVVLNVNFVLLSVLFIWRSYKIKNKLKISLGRDVCVWLAVHEVGTCLIF